VYHDVPVLLQPAFRQLLVIVRLNLSKVSEDKASTGRASDVPERRAAEDEEESLVDQGNTQHDRGREDDG
jgi:hypothetical protein